MFDFDLSNELLIRLFIFVLIFAISFQLVRKTLFQEQRALSGIIALVISLLGAFYISPSQLTFILDSYGATGILIAMAVPYLIVFYLIYVSKLPGVLRKITLLFMGIVTFAIIQNTSSLSIDITTKALMIVVAITMLALLFDNTIETYFNTKKNLKGI